MVNQTIECINQIDDVILESEVNVLLLLIDSYEKAEMIMENGGCPEIIEDRFFIEAAKTNNVNTNKEQSGFMKIVTAVKKIVLSFISKILEFFGFKKIKLENIDEDKSFVKSLGEKISDGVDKVHKFTTDHPIITALTISGVGLGIDALRMKGREKLFNEFKDEFNKCFNQALDKLSEEERECIKKSVHVDDNCHIKFSTPFNVEYFERTVNKFF